MTTEQQLPEDSAPQPAPKLTAVDLGLTEAAISSPKWEANQYIEPVRDGEAWCTREDAEEMLVLAAKSVMRGMAGIKATKYALSEVDSVLTLKLG